MEIKNAVIQDIDVQSRENKRIIVTATFEMCDGTMQMVFPLFFAATNCLVTDWLLDLLFIANTDSLRGAIGNAVRLKFDKEHVLIGHIVRDTWFNPYKLAKETTANAEK